MNPSELRMMWMSQYNPDRITLDEAASYYGHPTVGLSVIDEMSAQQTMDLNPMMSIVGGDFSGQAAAAAAAVAASSAAAAALSVQPTTLIATNPNDIYGLAQVGGLHQHLLQQSASAAFQNYTEIIDNDDGSGTGAGVSVNEGMKNIQNQYVVDGNHQIYDQMDDGYDENISELTPKQEIINIDDFVMMTDSNSYDGTDFMGANEKDVMNDETQIEDESGNDNSLLMPINKHKSLLNSKNCRSSNGASTSSGSSSGSGHRSQRKTRKIEPVNRPGLVLKTPIAYKGNIDPSVIPIQKDGMAVCERCGAIGVKHTFYTKSRRFCSMSCARGELHSLINNKMTGESQHQDHGSQQTMERVSSVELYDMQEQGTATTQQDQSELELALRVAHVKNQNYRFRITDQSKITQLNGNENNLGLVNDGSVAQSATNTEMGNEMGICAGAGAGMGMGFNMGGMGMSMDGSTATAQTPKALRMYRDVLPQDELPQIPKLERLPAPCPQMEKIISIRRRLYDPSHSYDWTPRLLQSGFFAAPITCFPHAPGYEVWDNIGVDMKVEVENTDCDNLEVIQPGQTPHSFWVATILIISGYKALMRYEGFDDNSKDFWVNLCNAEVHSVGWCATRGKPLIPPRTIEKKYKDWKDFLVERLSGARTLPSSFYNKIHDSMQSRFRLGLNLECVDKDRISQVRLATVTKIVGKRLFLRYFDSDDGFWCHEDSPIIHPVGWATTVGHNLAAPQDYLERMLAGREAMIEVHEDDATIELFKMNFTFEEYYLEGKMNGFIEGMKLEAVDPLNLSSICAATVMAVLKFGYMMIRIDSYQPDATGSDWFCYHEKSPCIFPVGFCASNGITLTPPNGYDVDTFNWETYLRETGCVAAGEHLFHRLIPNHGFQPGMSLECADLMDPRLVCVATVARVVGRLLKIHFDGWTDEYDQWLDCESPDIYPVGWCVLVNHKLEGPPVAQQTQQKATPKSKPQKKRKKKLTSPATTKSSEGASAVKPRTIALKTNPHLPKLSIKLELKPEHHNASFYEDSVPDGEEEEEFEDDSNGQYSDQSSSLTANETDKYAQSQNSNQARSTNSVAKTTSVSPAPPTVGRKATSYIGNSSVSNNKYIPRLIDSNDVSHSAHSTDLQTDLMPETWNIYDVSKFLRVNDCTAHCDTFSRNKIDGKRLMQLNKDDIITLLGMKVGPALKIYDLIQQLKCKMNPGKSRLHHKANKSFL